MTSTPGSPLAAHRVSQLRRLVAALLTAPVVILLAVAATHPDPFGQEPSPVVLLVLVVLVSMGLTTSEIVGHRLPALTTEEGRSVEATQMQALNHVQTATILRFALTEMPILLGLAASYVLDAGVWPLLVTVVLGLPAMAFETWPSRRNFVKAAESLEADGVRSWLPETLDA